MYAATMYGHGSVDGLMPPTPSYATREHHLSDVQERCRSTLAVHGRESGQGREWSGKVLRKVERACPTAIEVTIS